MKKIILLSQAICFLANCSEPIFISLGPDCYPALALRDFNLRQFALPFDWLITDNFMKVKLLIKDNFQHMFTEKYLEYQSHTHEHATLIRNHYYDISFIHDFPINNSSELIQDGTYAGKIVHNWREYIGAVEKKFRPRIMRFYDLLNSSKRLIFIRSKSVTPVEAKNFVSYLSETYPKLNFTLAIIHNDQSLHKVLNFNHIKSFLAKSGATKEFWFSFFKQFVNIRAYAKELTLITYF